MARPVAFLYYLVERGLLEREEVEEVIDAAAKSSQRLGRLLLRKKLVTLRQMVELLDRQACEPGRRLGELAVEAGYCTEAQLESMLKEQKGHVGQHPLDHLILSGRLSQQALMEALVSYVKLFDEPATLAAV